MNALETARCGVFDCNTCSHLVKGRCPGCEAGNLIVASDGRDTCSIFNCANAKGLASCNACTAAVCPFPHSLEMACPVRSQFEKTRCYSSKLSRYYTARQQTDTPPTGDRKVSDRTITRLRWYMVALNGFIDQGITRVSSQDIGRKVGVKPGLIRRDLSHFGEFGRPSVGYDAVFLRDRLQQILHLDNSKIVVWVGAHRLAADPSLLQRFADQNCIITALFDSHEDFVGKTVAGLEVSPVERLPEKARSMGAQGAVIEVRPEEAQGVADQLVTAGVTAMLNLTSAVIVTPPGIVVRNVDVAAELSALSYYCGGKHAEQ